MKGLKPFLTLLLGFAMFVIMTGCSGGTPQNGPGALQVANLSLAEGVVGVPYKQLLIASGGLTPYTWTLKSGTVPPGLSISSSGLITGIPTTTGTFSFVAKVTDSQTPVAAYNTESGTITINPPLTLTPISLQTGTVGVGYNQTIAAAGGVSPYNYTIIFNDLPSGLSLDPSSGAITGIPTEAGTFNFTVQVTDSISEVAAGNFVLTVVGRLQGGYGFTFNGFDSSSGSSVPFYTVGSFQADGNGNITSGVIDQNGAGGLQTALPIQAAYSSYTIPTGSNLGTLKLTTSLGTYTYSIAISTTSDSKIILADPAHPKAWGSGLVKKQLTTVLTPSVNYSFGFFGNDASSNRYVGAGMVALDGSLNVTGGVEDTNDNGTPSGEVAITGGSFSTPDFGTGRGTASFTTASGTASYAVYVISGGPTAELIALETDTGGNVSVASMLQQAGGAAGGGMFSNASLNGQSTMELNGVSDTSGSLLPDIAVGVASLDGAGGINRTKQGDGLPGFFTDENNGGNNTQNSYNGTYNVDPTCGPITSPCGRVTVALNGAPSQPVWYLVAPNQAFEVGGQGDTSATQGVLLPQSGYPFSLAAIIGSYSGGTATPVLASVTNAVEQAITPPPGGNFVITYDSNGPTDQPGGDFNQAFTGQYALDATTGAAFGKFVITNSGGAVSVLYVAGSGSAGATGAKSGLVGLNVGSPPDAPAGSGQTNPRLTVYGR